jgi:hypothetical protein
MSTQQQWITTNMRFPADLYLELKLEAARTRRSVTSLVHEKLRKKSTATKKDPQQLLRGLERLAKKNSKHFKGSLSDAVIEMRYEQ